MTKLKYLLLGQEGENLAANLFFQNGFKIIAQNSFNHKGKRVGEIDIIATKNKHIHFIEVKTRTSDTFGHVLEAVSKEKIQKTLRAIQFFLKCHQEFASFQPHFDVVTIEFSPFDKGHKKVKIYSDVIVDAQAEV